MTKGLALHRALRASLGLHVLGFVLLLIWGSRAPRTDLNSIIDVVLLEAPRGTSDTVGLGTVAEAPVEPIIEESAEPIVTETVEPAEETPQWTSQTIAQQTPPETAMPTPQTEAKPTPAKKKPTPPPTVATQTKPKKAAPPPKPKKTQRERLSETLQTVKSGGTGQKASPGWKHGTGNKPAVQASSSAILSRYKSQVRSKMLRQWAAPSDLKKLPPAKRPKAVVHVSVSSDGRITNSNWIKKSGNNLMDESVMRAVRRASPVPAPPADIKKKVLDEGLTLTFQP